MKFKILNHENKVNFLTLNKKLVVAIAILSLYACSSVKEYQKSKINEIFQL